MKYYYLTDDSERSLAPFFSKTVLSACFVGVVVIGLLLIFRWPRQPLFEFVGGNKTPMVFFTIFAATLIVSSYINLCCGCGELIRRGYYSIKNPTILATYEKENDFLTYGLIAFLLHSQIVLLLFLPLLILAAAISAVSIIPFMQAVSILISAALLCRMIGFMVYLIWGRTSTFGYFVARAFMIVFIFGTYFFASFLNPLQILYLLNKSMGDIGSTFALYMIPVIFAILLLIGANQILVRRHLREEGLNIEHRTSNIE